MTVTEAQPAARTLIRTTIDLPDDLLGRFEALAAARGESVEQAIIKHLSDTRYHTDSAEEAIYLNRSDSMEVRRLLGGRVNSAEKLIDMLRRLVTWKVGGFKFELSVARVEAVRSYARSYGMTVEKAGQTILNQAIGAFLKC